jgi:hypothetical protein
MPRPTTFMSALQKLVRDQVQEAAQGLPVVVSLTRDGAWLIWSA